MGNGSNDLLTFNKNSLYLQKHKGFMNRAETYLTYLADWKNILEYGEQITDAEWYKDANGTLQYEQGYLPKQLPLSEQNLKSIKHVINVTDKMTPLELNVLVYSTYPLMFSEKNEQLDLIKHANEYKLIRDKF